MEALAINLFIIDPNTHKNAQAHTLYIYTPTYTHTVGLSGFPGMFH